MEEASMDGLRVSDCHHCEALCDSRSQIVNGVGPASTPLVFLGEAPGADEDANGEPFVGRSGAILTEALSAAGCERSAVRITNCVRCRPPDNRNPHQEELENCRPYLESEIETIDPALVVTLGKVPAEHLLDESVAVTAKAGDIETIEIGGKQRQILISFHPAAVLYDRSKADRFESIIEEAVEFVGLGDGARQPDLSEFSTDD